MNSVQLVEPVSFYLFQFGKFSALISSLSFKKTKMIFVLNKMAQTTTNFFQKIKIQIDG
jgi:hypothetical protein